MNDTSVDARTAFETSIRIMAMEDAAFRAALIENPAKALENALGLTLKSGVTLRVVEEQAGEAVLVLPDNSGELTDAELEAASGGGQIGDIMGNYAAKPLPPLFNLLGSGGWGSARFQF